MIDGLTLEKSGNKGKGGPEKILELPSADLEVRADLRPSEGVLMEEGLERGLVVHGFDAGVEAI